MCGVKNILQEFELDTDVLKKNLKEIAGWGSDCVVLLTGGEPFLRKDIFDIIDYAVSYNGTVQYVGVISHNMSPLQQEYSQSWAISWLKLASDVKNRDFLFREATYVEGGKVLFTNKASGQETTYKTFDYKSLSVCQQNATTRGQCLFY